MREMPLGDELVGIGDDLSVPVLHAAYRNGVFPMGTGRRGARPIGWFSPDPRAVLLPGGLRVSRTLRKSLSRFDVTIDEDFAAVMDGCGDPSRTGRWITDEVKAAYVQLHREGWAHSVEVWRSGELVGGLYGVCIGGLFAGESMFHRVSDASKVALAALYAITYQDLDDRRVIDAQWQTAHLSSLGFVELARPEYLRRLDVALTAPAPAGWVRGPLRTGIYGGVTPPSPSATTS